MPTKTSITIDRLVQFWMEEVKPPIHKALELVPDDKLDWAPAKDMITLGNVFLHIGEASLWWIDTVIDDKKYADITKDKCPPKEEIIKVLDEHWQRLDGFFNRMPELRGQSFDLRRFKRDAEVKGEWIFLHLLEHDIHHRSQINHYLRILGIKPPRI
ncbi:MAG: DinB family protein [Candidatus Zixiibacteriota bacterium]|nr:MAG: DinB family protein [candidate division Zixibacteria bacterium]